MNVGNIVKWFWAIDSSSWASTEFIGTIVNSKLHKTDHEKVIVFNVLLTDGSLCDVREDQPGMELVA